jgi:nucleoside-diphosphate-sugar epimerase
VGPQHGLASDVNPPLILTGATGFIGSDVFARLLIEYQIPVDTIHLLVRRKPDPEKSLFALRLREYGLESLYSRIHFVEAALDDQAAVATALKQLEASSAGNAVLIHMAAVIHEKGDAALAERINVGLTHQLLDWSNQHAGHFIYLSSVVAFGGSPQPQIRSEKDFEVFPDPSSSFTYYTTKRLGHLRVRDNATVSASILCPGIVHGSLETFKTSRGHIKAIREGRLKWAPGGGNNVVGLDRVSRSICSAALGTPPPRGHAKTKLLVDRNVPYRDYFQSVADIALGERASQIRKIPIAVGYLAFVVWRLLAALGIHVWVLQGLCQGSLFLYFKSEEPQEATEGLENQWRKAFL